jgi:ferrous iron transport protein A
MKRITLRQMKDNQSGTIAAIKADGELGRRIRDMGLVPGTEIKIQGRAPLYDPVAIRLQCFTLTLRNSEADFIEVDVNDDINDIDSCTMNRRHRHRHRGGMHE